MQKEKEKKKPRRGVLTNPKLHQAFISHPIIYAWGLFHLAISQTVWVIPIYFMLAADATESDFILSTE